MKRREFIALAGGTAAAWPFGSRAQPVALPTIGVLLTGDPYAAVFLVGFRDSLRQAGFIEGQNIRLEVRSAKGDAALLPEMAAELVRLNVDIIVTSLTPPAEAAKRATSEIPIVMAPAGDPVATGLVPSLARPGGNITGLSAVSAEIVGKSFDLIREVLPAARRVAVLANEVDPFTPTLLAQIGLAARAHAITVEPVMIRPGAPLAAAFDAIVSQRADALILQGTTVRKEVFDLALEKRLPSFGSNRQVAREGGLMSYAASAAEVYAVAVDYVSKILQGRKPADLPVSLPTKFELVINLKTAQALGMVISPTLLARADLVIE